VCCSGATPAIPSDPRQLTPHRQRRVQPGAYRVFVGTTDACPAPAVAPATGLIAWLDRNPGLGSKSSPDRRWLTDGKPPGARQLVRHLDSKGTQD